MKMPYERSRAHRAFAKAPARKLNMIRFTGNRFGGNGNLLPKFGTSRVSTTPNASPSLALKP